MLKKALAAVEKYNMLCEGDCVIAAVSGGADSMAMLKFLMSVSERYSLTLTVAHVNHGLRGDEAVRDENYVRDFCRENSLEFRVLHADVAALAAESGESCEECGRRIRYEFFESIDPCAKIATAHTASDNAETMLFNLARGSSLKGLCGIPAVRGNIIRPLIFCTRADIESFCEENSLAFVTDSTNLSCDYSRNKLRHIAVPALKQVNSAFEENALRFSQNAELDEEYLALKTAELIERSRDENGYNKNVLLSEHPALCRRAVLSLLKQVCPDCADNKTVSSLVEILNHGGKIQLSSSLFAECRGDRLSFFSPEEPLEDWSEDVEKDCIDGVCEHKGRYSIFKVNRNVFVDTQKINKDILDYSVDCGRIYGNVQIGSRRAGDKLTLPKRGCTKSLKKLFNEAHVPSSKRNQIAVLRDERGVLWVEGFGADKRCRVNKNTENILVIRREK